MLRTLDSEQSERNRAVIPKHHQVMTSVARKASPPPERVIRLLDYQQDDATLARGLMAGDEGAAELLFDRHGVHVRRVLVRLLGSTQDIPELLHDVFVTALSDISKLREPASLKAWLTAIAVHTARGRIRRTSRWRWLRLVPPHELPDVAAPDADDEGGEALRATYSVLQRLPTDERIAFALRVIEGMELKQVAQACGVSLATIKRRLKRAEDHFVAEARQHPALVSWVEGGSRWGSR